MKIGIYCSIAAGDVKDRTIDYIGVDQGVCHLYQLGIKPILAIGDMDSIEDESLLSSLNIKRYSSIKDDTDTALAIDYAINHGYNEIDLYGVTKKRMDHFMAVLALLERYQHIQITIYDEYNKIRILPQGRHQINQDGYKYFSLFALDDSMISIEHAHYNLESYLLKRMDPLCVSNQTLDDYSIIETSKPILLFQTEFTL